MAKIKGNGKIIPVYKIRYAMKDGNPHDLAVRPVVVDGMIDPEKTALQMANKYGIVVLKFNKRATQTVIPFLRKLFERKNWRDKELVGTIEIFYKKRNNDQNALMWALLQILSMELYHDNGHDEELYYEIVDLVAPREQSRMTGNTVPKRGSSLSTVEFAVLIEYVFNYLMEHGVSMSAPEDIEHYWTEWSNWRWTQATDPMSKTYKDANDYRARVNYCEACRTFLNFDPDMGKYITTSGKEGNLAHIVSKGSGGSDELWNRMHLCTEHHIYLQHQQGWAKLVAEYPHLERRINLAREKVGQMPVNKEDAEETYSDMEVEEKQYLWNHLESTSWWIEPRRDDMDPLTVEVCEATQDKVLEVIAKAYNSETIDARMADEILGKVDVVPFYQKYQENMDSQGDLFDEPQEVEPEEPPVFESEAERAKLDSDALHEAMAAANEEDPDE